MHESCRAAYESLIGFNRAGHFVDASRVHSVTDTMKHEPRGTLSHCQIARYFIAGNAILAIANKPHRAEPLIQRNRTILENCADLDRELLTASKARPHQPSFQKRQLLARAFGALRAVGPLRLGNSFKAHHWVRKILNGFHQATLTVEVSRLHTSTIRLDYV